MLEILKTAVSVAQSVGFAVGHGELFRAIVGVVRDEAAGKPVDVVINDALAIIAPQHVTPSTAPAPVPAPAA